MAAAIEPGPWLCHVSGALGLEALAPHARRFAVHPLQTFQHGLGPGQLDGAWGAVTAGGTSRSRRPRSWHVCSGSSRSCVADEDRAIYHAAATVASPFLVTLHAVAAELMRAAGAPPEALLPLMRRTIENGFQPTGPHVRGDWETVERHAATIRARRPQLEPVYRELSRATATLLGAAS